MRRKLVTLPLEKQRYNAKAIWSNYELYIYGDKLQYRRSQRQRDLRRRSPALVY
jgi:hypothetical protein